MQAFGSAFRGVILALRKAPSGARSLRSLRSGWSMVSGPLKKVGLPLPVGLWPTAPPRQNMTGHFRLRLSWW